MTESILSCEFACLFRKSTYSVLYAGVFSPFSQQRIVKRERRENLSRAGGSGDT
jgi:hypothetical protein